MYLELLNSLRIEDLILEDYKILAHIGGKEKKEESLKNHTELCKEYLKILYKEKDLGKIFLNFEKIFLENPNLEEENLFREMLLCTIVLHDVGKINPNFQELKMKNKLKIDMGENLDTNHSIYSSLIYINTFTKRLKKLKGSKENQRALLSLLVLNSYIISKHHSKIDSLEAYIGDNGRLQGLFKEGKLEEVKKLLKLYKEGFILSKKYIGNLNSSLEKFLLRGREKEGLNFEIGLYTYERFILSILIGCDYYATSEYVSGTKIRDIGTIKDIDKFYEGFKKGKIYKSIRKYEKEYYKKDEGFNNPPKDINILRNELFLEAEEELLKNIDKNLFYLEAPTGSGKSNVANNLSFKIIEKNPSIKKIFYVYPFNTLVEQNLKSLEEIYKEDKEVFEEIAVINSLFPYKEEKGEEEYKDYSKSLLNREFLNYPFILTTNVSLFSYMFSTKKENIFAFHQLANSLIVLDEIQSYKNKIWREIISFLDGFSKILNIKVIIMSATLPNLQGLLNLEGDLKKEEDRSVNLIKNRDKYFKNPLFKKRVEIDYSLMDLKGKEEIFPALILKLKEYRNKNRLLEFIDKESAYSFYRELKDIESQGEDLGKIRLLTGDDNSVEREKIIREIREEKGENSQGIILVATQVIEAGVDIDMDIGFKDSSLLDSEEQFLGRINRSCLKKGSKAYFFNLTTPKSIYKEDIRKNESLTIEKDDIRNLLVEKDFKKYNALVNKFLLEKTGEKNSNNTERFFENQVRKLDFKAIEEKMKLIDDDINEVQVFFNYSISVLDDKGEPKEKIEGKEVFEEYKSLLSNNNIDYAKKMVTLSKIKAKMNYFIYSMKVKEAPSFYDYKIGELLYVEKGEDYFIEGKLNKSKFIESSY